MKKINNVLFKEKLYNFLIDEENKKLILSLYNIFVIIILMSFVKDFFIMLISYFLISFLSGKFYNKLINFLFDKNKNIL